MSAPSLRAYQINLLESVSRAAGLYEGGLSQELKGLNRLLLKSGTGTGKTVSVAAMLRWPAIKAWLETFPENDRRMMMIAHREELLTQAQDKIQKANPGLMVSIEQGENLASVYSDVVVASIQTLSAMKFRRLHRLIARHPFRLVVVDEAHHSAAATYRTALVHLGFLPPSDASDKNNIEAPTFDDVEKMQEALGVWDQRAPKDRLLVGVTATPNRSDAIGLGAVFQSIAYSYDLKKAIDDGWLVPITPWAIDTETSLDKVGISHGDFKQNELADAVNNRMRNRLALAAWQEHANGRSTIGFTVNVQHAHDLAELFQRNGVQAVALSGETPTEDRRQMLRDYTEGFIEVIFNCMVLTEGTDLPRTGCILHCKPTKSATLYEQMTGRGLRIHPGKTECVVIDIVDIARKHSLQTAPILYGLPPGLIVKGKQLKELSDELDAFREQHPNFDVDSILSGGRRTLEQLGALATRVDPWAIQSLGSVAEATSLNWLKTGESYRLAYPWADGTEVLTIEKNLLGKWDLVATMRPKDYRAGTRQRTMATDVPTPEAALSLADTFVRAERRSTVHITDRNATWRTRPASGPQLDLMARLHVPIKPKLTMGEASDLITLAKAMRRH